VVANSGTTRVEKGSRIAGLWNWALHGWRRVATILAVFLAVGVGYHVVFGQNGLVVYKQKRHEEQHLAEQLQSLTKENEHLKTHVDHLQNDPDAIEHQAREELHYARPGEVIYTLPATTSAPAGGGAAKR